MSNVAIFKNGRAQYLTSVNTPDYSSDPDVMVNPNISAIQNVPLRYWKRNGNAIEEMSLQEKQDFDNAEFLLTISGIKNEILELSKVLLSKGAITKIELINLIENI